MTHRIAGSLSVCETGRGHLTGSPLSLSLLPLEFRRENGPVDGISHQMGRVGATGRDVDEGRRPRWVPPLGDPAGQAVVRGGRTRVGPAGGTGVWWIRPDGRVRGARVRWPSPLADWPARPASAPARSGERGRSAGSAPRRAAWNDNEHGRDLPEVNASQFSCVESGWSWFGVSIRIRI